MPDNYGKPRWQFAASQQLGRCTSRPSSNCATAIKAEGIGELELIQGELDAVQADLRRDLAYAELRNSCGQVFASAGINLLPSTLPSMSWGRRQYGAWPGGTHLAGWRTVGPQPSAPEVVWFRLINLRLLSRHCSRGASGRCKVILRDNDVARLWLDSGLDSLDGIGSNCPALLSSV